MGPLIQEAAAIVLTAFAAVADHVEPENRSIAMAAAGIPTGAAFVIALYMRGTLFFVGFSGLEPILPSLVSKAAPSSPCGTTLDPYNSLQFLGSFVGASVAAPVAGFSPAPIATTLALASVRQFLLMVFGPADLIQGREN